MKNKKFYTAKYDFVFKTIFCNEDDPRLLKEFLSRILNKKVKKIVFKRNELPKRYVKERGKIVDVVVLVDDEYIHIEMNVGLENYTHVRNFCYFSSIYNRITKVGEDYVTNIKFIHIDFTYGMSNKEYDYSKYYLINENDEKYIENFEIIEYNMNRLMKYWKEKDKEKINQYKHLIMLDLDNKELPKITGGDKFMTEFEEVVEKFNKSGAWESWITPEEDYQKCLNSEKKLARMAGHEEGMKEEKINSIKEMIKINIPKDQICQILRISLKEYEDLVKNFSKKIIS